MRRSRGGAAFYVETLLLVLFLLASLTVLVQILGAAKRTSREARELSTAVSIAQNWGGVVCGMRLTGCFRSPVGC